MPPPSPCSWTLQPWSRASKMKAGNLLARPIGPNPSVLEGSASLSRAEERESLLGGRESLSRAEQLPRAGSNMWTKYGLGATGPFPGPSGPMLTPGPCSRTLQRWSRAPKMRAGNLLARPIGPNLTVSMRASPGAEFLHPKCVVLLAGCKIQYGLACRFSKVWQGYPCNLWAWKPRNTED